MAMRDVDDKYIVGWVEQTAKVCGNCGEGTLCIHVKKIRMPDRIDPKDHKIIFIRIANRPVQGQTGPYLGIGCGCYATAHRQMAHVEGAIKRRESARARVRGR
jgi:hypothetical protein